MPTSSRIPHLRALEVFDAVAAAGGMRAAAERLHVTQPAVSQQVHRLESVLGVELVRRVPGGVELTDAGRRLAARTGPAFAALHGAIEELREARGGLGAVSVSLLATFAQRWLIPRLAGFQRAHPRTEVRLLTATRLEDLGRGDPDLVVDCGEQSVPGAHTDPLMANALFPVASPVLLESGRLVEARDLADHVLLRVDTAPRDRDWERWLQAAGVAGLRPRGWLTFTSSIHALEAAVAGLGVAVGHTPFVVDAIAAGHLVAPLARYASAEGPYRLVARGAGAQRPPVRAFRDWLLAEVAASPHADPV
ncbi:MAG: LysR family transcriptional regulator [Ectothiorhodospiraceae bacterium]|nr:LysR family transcriptional regulator [Chromatiales bacterium]MCP5154960.1 LysR family transcriptional regulator [Ectothiorhodospiraceae bacterium]